MEKKKSNEKLPFGYGESSSLSHCKTPALVRADVDDPREAGLQYQYSA